MDVVGQIMGNYSAKQHFFGLCWMALDSSSNPTLSAILRQALATLAASAGQAVSSERSRRMSRAEKIAESATVAPPHAELQRSRAPHLWFDSCTPPGVSQGVKRFVYILRSGADPTLHYVGLTSDVRQRLDSHNAGQNVSTAGGRPWRVIASIEFETAAAARAFERYLKSGSGRGFAKRHFP